MMKGILYIVELDFRNFFRYKWWLVGLISMNLADLFIMAVVYNHMLAQAVTERITSYFDFFAPGLAVTGLFASAFMIGREVNMERRREIHHYMLSIPMSRYELAFGRVISGGLQRLGLHDTVASYLLHIRRLSYTTTTTAYHLHTISVGHGHLRVEHNNSRVHLKLRKIRHCQRAGLLHTVLLQQRLLPAIPHTRPRKVWAVSKYTRDLCRGQPIE